MSRKGVGHRNEGDVVKSAIWPGFMGFAPAIETEQLCDREIETDRDRGRDRETERHRGAEQEKQRGA